MKYQFRTFEKVKSDVVILTVKDEDMNVISTHLYHKRSMNDREWEKVMSKVKEEREKEKKLLDLIFSKSSDLINS